MHAPSECEEEASPAARRWSQVTEEDGGNLWPGVAAVTGTTGTDQDLPASPACARVWRSPSPRLPREGPCIRAPPACIRAPPAGLSPSCLGLCCASGCGRVLSGSLGSGVAPWSTASSQVKLSARTRPWHTSCRTCRSRPGGPGGQHALLKVPGSSRLCAECARTPVGLRAVGELSVGVACVWCRRASWRVGDCENPRWAVSRGGSCCMGDWKTGDGGGEHCESAEGNRKWTTAAAPRPAAAALPWPLSSIKKSSCSYKKRSESCSVLLLLRPSLLNRVVPLPSSIDRCGEVQRPTLAQAPCSSWPVSQYEE
jgi:hypothetical protein